MSATQIPQRTIKRLLSESVHVHMRVIRSQLTPIARAAELLVSAMQADRKLIWFGNGGSATQSQHMAAEFVGRFGRDRRSLPSIALTENMASVTAIANDYAYERIFARQLEGLSQPGDVAVGLSTSGSSANVLAGLHRARKLGLVTIGLTGAKPHKMRPHCDVCIAVPSTDTARIQEAHLTIGHILCALVEDAVIPQIPTPPRARR